MYQDNSSSLSLALCVISVIVTSRITHRIGISMDGRTDRRVGNDGRKKCDRENPAPFHLLTSNGKDCRKSLQ